MSIKLSDSIILDSPDGTTLRKTIPVASTKRTEEIILTNSAFYIQIVEIVKDHASDLFDNAGLTDNANIWQQPAHSVLLGAKMRLDTQFAAAGMTDLDVTLGDGGNNSGILNPAMNLTTDAATTEYKDRGAYWNTTGGHYVASATQWIGYATAVGANLSTTSAGQVTFYFYYLEV